jgi:hypothetical protein
MLSGAYTRTAARQFFTLLAQCPRLEEVTISRGVPSSNFHLSIRRTEGWLQQWQDVLSFVVEDGLQLFSLKRPKLLRFDDSIQSSSIPFPPGLDHNPLLSEAEHAELREFILNMFYAKMAVRITNQNSSRIPWSTVNNKQMKKNEALIEKDKLVFRRQFAPTKAPCKPATKQRIENWLSAVNYKTVSYLERDERSITHTVRLIELDSMIAYGDDLSLRGISEYGNDFLQWSAQYELYNPWLDQNNIPNYFDNQAKHELLQTLNHTSAGAFEYVRRSNFLSTLDRNGLAEAFFLYMILRGCEDQNEYHTRFEDFKMVDLPERRKYANGGGEIRDHIVEFFHHDQPTPHARSGQVQEDECVRTAGGHLGREGMDMCNDKASVTHQVLTLQSPDDLPRTELYGSGYFGNCTRAGTVRASFMFNVLGK